MIIKSILINCLAALTVVASVPSTLRAEVVNRIVATIDGEPITQIELERYTEVAKRRPGGDQMAGDQKAMLDELVLDKIINKQVEAYYFIEAVWPSSLLTNIRSNENYFPDGIPTCPVDQTSYTLVPSPSHRVAGHREGDDTHVW